MFHQIILSDAEIDEWNEAMEEYHAKHGSPEPLELPVGTVALYGPDDKTTTKIVAGVFLEEDVDPIIERWVGTDVEEKKRIRRCSGKSWTFLPNTASSPWRERTRIWAARMRKAKTSRWGKTVHSARSGKVSREVTHRSEFDLPVFAVLLLAFRRSSFLRSLGNFVAGLRTIRFSPLSSLEVPP